MPILVIEYRSDDGEALFGCDAKIDRPQLKHFPSVHARLGMSEADWDVMHSAKAWHDENDSRIVAPMVKILIERIMLSQVAASKK